MSAASIARTLREAVRAAGDPKVAKQKARYFKHVCDVAGVYAKPLKDLLRTTMSKDAQASLGHRGILDVGKICLEDNILEMKMLGVQTWTIATSPRWCKGEAEAIAVLAEVEGVFERQHAFDWATVDGLSGQVVHYVLKRFPSVTDRVVGWSTSSNMWQQRCSCVSFVKLGSDPSWSEPALRTARTVVRNKERFAQLGVGWLLRELTVGVPQEARAFLAEWKSDMSREGLRYAIEKMESEERSEFMATARRRKRGRQSAEDTCPPEAKRTAPGTRDEAHGE